MPVDRATMHQELVARQILTGQPPRLVEQYGDEQDVAIVEEETELPTVFADRHLLNVPTAKLFDGVSDAAEVGDGRDHRAGWFIP